MGGFDGSGIAGAIDSNIQRHKTDERADDVALRERQANEIESAISGIQARTDLSPQEKAGQIDAARAQLQKLYKPHEANSLFERLERIFKHDKTGAGGATSVNLPGAPEFPVGGKTEDVTGASGGVQLKPGLTIAEVLAAGSPQPKPAAIISKTPTQGADGKWYVIQQDAQGNVTSKEIPGYTEQTLQQQLKEQGYTDEQIKSYMDIQAGVKAKPISRSKGLKYDTATDEVVDQDTGTRYTRDGADNPEEVAQMFSGASKVQKHKEEIADHRFQESLLKQRIAIQAVWDKGDHTAARKEINKAKVDLVQANSRVYQMDKNLPEALAGNQQAELALVANHIGMTLGAQKGARITRAVWEEAIASAPWLDQKLSHFFVTDPNTGDRVLVAPMSGVTLTPEQMHQMVELAHDKADVMEKTVGDYEKEFPEGEGGPPSIAKKGESKGGGTVHFTEGSDHWDIPADKVAAFKIKHPNAKEQ